MIQFVQVILHTKKNISYKYRQVTARDQVFNIKNIATLVETSLKMKKISKEMFY